MAITTCAGCGATKPGPDGSPTDVYPSTHCDKCPPWKCEICGDMSSADALCGCWVSLAEMPLADVKTLFARDGGFDITPTEEPQP
ncbi:hypothetical protein ACFVFS_05710 [Kitasatospora sp. NPDC057692]|uniref:hypothetical protein n=1 Tax=Kitasatospora sp. NPDC057692 TaxID=3346215 RepID=UPI00369DB676